MSGCLVGWVTAWWAPSWRWGSLETQTEGSGDPQGAEPRSGLRWTRSLFLSSVSKEATQQRRQDLREKGARPTARIGRGRGQSPVAEGAWPATSISEGRGHTVDLLNALQVVQRQPEVVRVHVLVEGGHDGAGVVGVLQAQGVTQLVDRHQEQVVPYRRKEK